MRVALVNPNWTFDGSIYFGCREPHLPLSSAGAGRCSEREGHAVAHRRRPPVRARAWRHPGGAARRSAPTCIVVTTAPDLPVLALRAARAARAAGAGPGAGRRGAADRGGRPARLDHPGRRLAQARRRRRGHGRVRGGGRPDRRRRLGRACRARPLATATGSQVNGGPQAARFVDAAPLAWPDEWVARHHHHHHRFDAAPVGPGRRGRGVARLPLQLHLLRQGELPRPLPPPRRRRGRWRKRRGCGRRAPSTSTSSTRSSCPTGRCSRGWSAAG